MVGYLRSAAADRTPLSTLQPRMQFWLDDTGAEFLYWRRIPLLDQGFDKSDHERYRLCDASRALLRGLPACSNVQAHDRSTQHRSIPALIAHGHSSYPITDYPLIPSRFTGRPRPNTDYPLILSCCQALPSEPLYIEDPAIVYRPKSPISSSSIGQTATRFPKISLSQYLAAPRRPSRVLPQRITDDRRFLPLL